jgi:hypothetical protein
MGAMKPLLHVPNRVIWLLPCTLILLFSCGDEPDPVSPCGSNHNSGNGTLILEPGRVIFSASLGETDDAHIYLLNEGQGGLCVGGISLEDEHGVFEIEGEAPPFIIPPGEESMITVYFSPSLWRDFSGELNLETDDPQQVNAMVTLIGEIDQL